MHKSRHLGLILEKTGGSLFVFIPQLAQLTGWSEKRIRNAPDKFPLKIQKVGSRVGVPAVILADFMDRLVPGEDSIVGIEINASPNRRGRGRPRKLQQS